MKTEDCGNDSVLTSLSPPSPLHGIPSSNADSAGLSHPVQPKRTVCDHCRRRRIRCDGKLPCQPCINASLVCKRDHIPLKRGPKRGRGRVINELRERYSLDGGTVSKHSRESSAELANIPSTSIPSTPRSPPLPPSDISWQNVSSDPRHAPEPGGAFSTEQFRPTSRSYIPLAPRCIELYYEHVYPIMPLPYMPAVRAMVVRSPSLGDLTPSERTYLFALCSLTCFHMSGQNITADAPIPSWESAGRFFLDECIGARQAYDFFSDQSLHAVVSSFWLSTSFFEINQSRKSWLYLREALSLAQELRLHDDSAYYGLDAAETLCRQRVFWQLFVTERSFAILRNKPITLKKTPALPTTRHPYEDPEIHSGFLQLISSYVPLDESFVNAWNEGTDPRVSATTYLALQNILAQPPSFLRRKHAGPIPSAAESPISDTTSPANVSAESTANGEPENQGAQGKAAEAAGVDAEPDTTAIQKADLLVTQQWLRLIVWQSSFRQGLLSWLSPDESMRFTFPLSIASRTAAVLQGLPPQAIEVHGMGIFEKIFEIGTWSMNVLEAYNKTISNTSTTAAGGITGMDFAGATDIGVLGVGRIGTSIDPLEFFVRTLSASPNSRTQYAERLLMFANEHPSGMRMALSPSLSYPPSPELLASPGQHTWDGAAAQSSNMFGTILGEVTDDVESGEATEAIYQEDPTRSSSLSRGSTYDWATNGSRHQSVSSFGEDLHVSEGYYGLSYDMATSPSVNGGGNNI